MRKRPTQSTACARAKAAVKSACAAPRAVRSTRGRKAATFEQALRSAPAVSRACARAHYLEQKVSLLVTTPAQRRKFRTAHARAYFKCHGTAE